MPITLKELMHIMKFLWVWNMLYVLMKPLFLKSLYFSNFLKYQSRHWGEKSSEEDSINSSLFSSILSKKIPENNGCIKRPEANADYVTNIQLFWAL